MNCVLCTVDGREHVLFKHDLNLEVSEAADEGSGSREFHTEGTAVENVHDAQYEATAGFEKRKADDDRRCMAS